MGNINYRLSSKTKELYNQIIELIKLSDSGYSDNNYSYENFIKECFYEFDSIVDHTPAAISKWINGESIDSKRVNIAIQNILAVEDLGDILADSLDKMAIDKNDIHSLLVKLLSETDLEITDAIRSLANHELFAILLYTSLNIVNCNDISDNYIETNHFKGCLETLNSKITNNPIVHIYAPYGSGKTTLIQKYMSNNTDDSMIYTTDNTSDNIMELISDTAKSFWKKLYESKIDTKIFNLFFQNDTSNYFAIIKNSIFFIDDFSPANFSVYVEFATQHNLRVVFISNCSIKLMGVHNSNFSLRNTDIAELLNQFNEIYNIEPLQYQNTLSKLIEIIGHDLNVYQLIITAYKTFKKNSNSTANSFICSITSNQIFGSGNIYQFSFNSTDKHFIAHLRQYYNDYIINHYNNDFSIDHYRKSMYLLSMIGNLPIPYNCVNNWFGIDFAFLHILYELNLCQIEANNFIRFNISNFLASTLNWTQKWNSTDLDIYINFINKLKNDIYKVSSESTSPEILMPILRSVIYHIDQNARNIKYTDKNKEETKQEIANFYVACIWYLTLHGDSYHANIFFDYIDSINQINRKDISIFLLEHTKELIDFSSSSQLAAKHQKNLITFNKVYEKKASKNSLHAEDIFFYIQELVTWLDNYLADILFNLQSYNVYTLAYCHNLLNILCDISKNIDKDHFLTEYYISILYCDFYKWYFEKTTNYPFDPHKEYYNQISSDIETAFNTNNYYALSCKLRKHIIELFINVNDSEVILTEKDIISEVNEISTIHSSYSAWTEYDSFLYINLISNVVYYSAKIYPNSIEIANLNEKCSIMLVEHMKNNEELYKRMINKHDILAQNFIKRQ